jgi:hypothetical protein
MEIKEEKKLKKNLHRFVCEHCDFKCYMKCDWRRHIIRPKHINLVSGTNWNEKNLEKTYSCPNCTKYFATQSGLWKHKKKCSIISCKEDLNDSIKQQQLIDYLLKENAEFKQLMMEQNKNMLELAKNAGSYNTNTTNNNSNNNFNLNFFLNETCKNAMNIMDFVSKLQVGIKELEETGRLGFAEGISKIFINGLKDIEINDRPIHCSDSKREVVYIKDKNQWNKDSEDKPILTSAIKQVVRKNINQISEWAKGHPEYNDSSSKQNDRYLKIVSNSMCGSTKEETEKNYEKIIRNIVKETMIDKQQSPLIL